MIGGVIAYGMGQVNAGLPGWKVSLTLSLPG